MDTLFPHLLNIFAARDPYAGMGLHSRVMQNLADLGSGSVRLREAVQRRASATDFLRGEVGQYFRAGIRPTSEVLAQLAGVTAGGFGMELPQGEGLRLWQQAWIEQRFGSHIVGQDRGGLPNYWHRYLPLHDKHGRRVEEYTARMVGILPPPGVPLRAVVGAVFGLSNPIEFSAERVEALARGGVVTFVLDMPIAQADVLAEPPLERRFASHLGLTYTVADFFAEIGRIVDLHSELQGLPRGAIGESLGGYFIPEAIVVLGRDLAIDRLALHAPRLEAGVKYDRIKIRHAQVSWLISAFPSLAGTSLGYYRKSLPVRRPAMTEAAFERAVALHHARVGVDNLHPSLATMFEGEVKLMAALQAGGHHRLPHHLRIGYLPWDIEVGTEAILELVKEVTVAREGAVEVFQQRDHSDTKYRPRETLPPLVEFLTDYPATAAELGLA